MRNGMINTALAIVAVAAVVAAIHEHGAAGDAQRALADAASTTARVRQQLADQKAETEKAISRPPAAPAPEVKTRPAAAGPISPFASLLRMMADPRMQRLTSIQAKMRLDGQYGPLFKSINLTPQQLDQFKSLLVEKEMVAFDSMAAAQEQGIDLKSDPKGFFAAVAAGQKSVESQISDLLGAGNYGQFQQYQETIPARNTANLLQQSLSYTSTPLTADQSAGLVQILAQYATPPLPANNPFAVLNNDLGVISLGSEAFAQLQGVLSAPQIDALKADVRQQRLLYQARRQSAH